MEEREKMKRRSANTIPYPVLAELRDYLHQSGSALSQTEALALAIRQWISAQLAAAVPMRGYQWKSLFLPAGTRLRVHNAGQAHYAEIVGERLMYACQSTTPRQFTIAALGAGRNAWLEIWLRRPGDASWIRASALRAPAPATDAAPAPASPTEAIQAAAKSMSDALQTALILVDHTRLRAEHQVERRIAKHRRRDDFVLDDWKAD